MRNRGQRDKLKYSPLQAHIYVSWIDYSVQPLQNTKHHHYFTNMLKSKLRKNTVKASRIPQRYNL